MLCVLFISLGNWQLHRAIEKEQILRAYQSQVKSTPVALENLSTATDWHYRHVSVTGQFDNPHVLLLDNKIHEHRAGYEVIIPFQLAQGGNRVLIDLGWIPAPEDRTQLPIIPALTGLQTLTGVIYQPIRPPFLLGQATEIHPRWPLRIQGLDFNAIQTALKQPVPPFVIWLDPNMPQGFVRQWQPIASTPEKHRAYAFQWFTFAAALIIIFIALSFRCPHSLKVK